MPILTTVEGFPLTITDNGPFLSVSESNLPVGFIPEYQALYDEFINKPSYTEANKQNTLIKTLVDNGIWDKFSGFYLLGAHTNDNGESIIDAKNPGTYSAELYNSPTYTNNVGFKGNGSTSYLRIPSWLTLTVPQNQIFVGAYEHTNLQERSALFAVNNTSNHYIGLWPNWETNEVADGIQSALNHSFSLVTNVPSTTKGLSVLSRQLSSSSYLEYTPNGTVNKNISYAGDNNQNILLLAQRNQGPISNYANREIGAFFFGSDYLVASECDIIRDAFDVYFS